MKGRVFNALLFLATILVISSCCKKRTFCSNEKLKIAFVGFDRSAIRTVILKRYTAGDKERKKALDSSQLVNNTTLTIVPGKPDTSWLSSYTMTSGTTDGVVYGNDWVLYLPGLNRTFALTDIYQGDNRFVKVPCKDNETKCSNAVKSYSIEGFWVESSTVYIKK